jgi:DNA-binding transcriptional LysR family regulator
LSGAAKRLGLTQSAISQAMQAFEDSLGQKLFDRSLRPPAFTMTGRLILQHAKDILERTQQLEHALRFSSQAQLPLLRLGVIDTFATLVIPHLITDLRDIAANWSITSGAAETAISAVLEHRADLIITTDDPEGQSSLAVKPILREDYCLVLPKDFRFNGGSLKTVSQRLDFVRYGISLHMKADVDRYVDENGIETSRKYQLNSVDAVMAMVAAGLGWSITTPFALLKAQRHLPNLQCVPLPDAQFARTVSLVGHAGDSSAVMDKIFASAVRILTETTMPQIRAMVPDLSRTIRIGEEI